jgi:hypothetical protein
MESDLFHFTFTLITEQIWICYANPGEITDYHL